MQRAKSRNQHGSCTNTAVFRSLFIHYHSTLSCLLKSLPSKWFKWTSWQFSDPQEVLFGTRLHFALYFFQFFDNSNIPLMTFLQRTLIVAGLSQLKELQFPLHFSYQPTLLSSRLHHLKLFQSHIIFSLLPFLVTTYCPFISLIPPTALCLFPLHILPTPTEKIQWLFKGCLHFCLFYNVFCAYLLTNFFSPTSRLSLLKVNCME